MSRGLFRRLGSRSRSPRAAAPQNDIQTLVTALGGDSAVLGVYDTNYNVTASAGLVQTWDDARGAAGYGPTINGMGATKPAWDSGAQIITTSGSNWLQSVAGDRFKLSGDRTLVLIAALDSAANFAAGISSDPYSASTYFTVGGNPTTGTSGLTGVATTGIAPDGTTFRLILAHRQAGGTTGNYIQVWGKSRINSETGDGVDSTFTRCFHFGGLPNAGALLLGAASKIKAALILDHKPTAAETDAIRVWAGSRFTAATTAPTMICDGNSLTAGTGVVAATEAWPVKFAAKPLAAGYDVLNYGFPGRTGTVILSIQDKRVLTQYNSARSKNVYVYWEGINDLGTHWATVGDAGVAGNVQSACAAAKARGFITVVCTCIKWGADPFAVPRGTYNTFVRTAVAGGWADVTVDLDADAAFSNTGDTTYFNADLTHLTIAGYQKVADLVYTAVSALL